MKNHYKDAAKIDQEICKVHQKNPITLANARNWITFCRTITSGLDILRAEATDLLLEDFYEEI